MDLKFLKKFEDKRVRVILKNGFQYNNINFKITPENYLEFLDKQGDTVFLEPESINMISEMGGNGYG